MGRGGAGLRAVAVDRGERGRALVAEHRALAEGPVAAGVDADGAAVGVEAAGGGREPRPIQAAEHAGVIAAPVGDDGGTRRPRRRVEIFDQRDAGVLLGPAGAIDGSAEVEVGRGQPVVEIFGAQRGRAEDGHVEIGVDAGADGPAGPAARRADELGRGLALLVDVGQHETAGDERLEIAKLVAEAGAPVDGIDIVDLRRRREAASAELLRQRIGGNVAFEAEGPGREAPLVARERAGGEAGRVGARAGAGGEAAEHAASEGADIEAGIEIGRGDGRRGEGLLARGQVGCLSDHGDEARQYRQRAQSRRHSRSPSSRMALAPGNPFHATIVTLAAPPDKVASRCGGK